MLQPTLTSLASDIAYKIRNNRKLNDSDISRGYLIYENVWQHNPELLEEADSLAEQDRAKAAETSDTMSPGKRSRRDYLGTDTGHGGMGQTSTNS